MSSLQEMKPELSKEWHPTKNGALTPNDVTPFSRKKVWWICAHGHEWEATVANRSNGTGCPVCRRLKVAAGSGSLAEKNPELSKEWHPTKNGVLTPNDVALFSRKRVWWLCPQGHEWEAVVASRAKGCGCPVCLVEKRMKKERREESL